MAAPTALITGGGGFIGSHLVDRLLTEGWEVRVLDNFATGHRRNLAGTIEHIDLVEGDVQSYERVHNAVRGCEVVFHQAALPSVPRSVADPLTSNATNVTGTLNVLLASRDSGVRRVVYASSSSAYGPSEGQPKREDMPSAPISPYAIAKLAGEGYCRAFNEVYGLETVSLRYFNVFGPRQDPNSEYSAVIPLFIRCFREDRPPTVFGDGEQSRDFTYIDNVIEANALAARVPEVNGATINVACGERIALNEILAGLRELTGAEIEAVHTDPRPGDVRHSQADVTRAREMLGFEPTVFFADGLRRTVEDFSEVPAGAEPVVQMDGA